METLRVAYADPPYIGQARKHYKNEDSYNGEVHHGRLIHRLKTEYPDGWALSCHTPSLGIILSLCETLGLSLYKGDIRVMAWVKTFGAYKKNVRVAYVWEPVIVCPPRRLEGAAVTRDFSYSNEQDDEQLPVLTESITMRKGLSGAKPERFAYWLFNVLGLRPCDQLDDLFPGTAAVGDAFEKWKAEGGPKLKQSVKVTNECIPS